ncbi:MAG: dTDP-4-dehydrorhamnose reductase [Proteobacteria bacterium]|nr:dTDP-4-dehydrorhamnose reductase [Pseudomonadota bacterium]MBI3499636.1 dTDP-4-dehydrorhamnose reductase [Pseudomonadota bacterium]
MIRLLLTGGTGQVGEALGRLGPFAGAAVEHPSRAELDLARPETVAAAVRRCAAEIVVNCAAYTAVDRAETERASAEAVNASGPGYLADACAARGVPLIHISTDYVFDGSKAGAYVEGDPVAPLGVYGRSKEAGERAVRSAWDRHVILRTSWVYSAHGQNFVKTMLRLAGERSEWGVVDDQVGAPTAADDIAGAVLAIAPQLLEPATARWGTYHYTAEGQVSWHGFARAIVERAAMVTGKRPTVKAIPTSAYPTPVRRPQNSVLDCSKVIAAFAPPRRPWQAGLKDVLDLLLALPKRGAA